MNMMKEQKNGLKKRKINFEIILYNHYYIKDNVIMIRTLCVFIFGVYVGQEYGNLIPNVKSKTYEVFENFKTTELYKKINEDLKKN